MKKSIYMLLGILLICVLVYFLLIQKEKKTFAPERKENFLEIDSALVSRIVFRKFDTQLVFQKVKDLWYIITPDSFRADRNVMGQLLSAASHLEVEELISSNPEKQAFFRVDSISGTGLDFFAGERQLTSVVLGKISSDLLHGYLRKTNSDDVYMVKGVFSRLADRRIDNWRDRNICPFDPKQVKRVKITQGEEEFILTKEDTLWQLSLYPFKEASPVEGKLVDDYVQSLANMKADEFAGKSEISEIDASKAELVITITFLDGHTENLFAVRRNAGEDRYRVKTDQDNNVFVLFEYNFKRIAKKTGRFPAPKGELKVFLLSGVFFNQL